jgi:hypothetical protein
MLLTASHTFHQTTYERDREITTKTQERLKKLES